jgi:hypothetical protein
MAAIWTVVAWKRGDGSADVILAKALARAQVQHRAFAVVVHRLLLSVSGRRVRG